MALWIDYTEQGWELWRGSERIDVYATLDDIEQDFNAALAGVLGTGTMQPTQIAWPPPGIGIRLT